VGTPFITLAIVALAGLILWRLAQPRPVFRVRIEMGQPRVVRGTVTPTFLAEVEQICRQHALSRGEIRGVMDGQARLALRFTRSIPWGTQQQLRNWWAEFGWRGPPNNPPPPRRRVATR